MATRLSISAPARADPRTEAQTLVPLGESVARFLKSTLFPRIKNLVNDYQFHQGRPGPVVEEKVKFVKDQYLPYLEFDLADQMTDRLADYGKVKEALSLMRNTKNKLPKDIAKKADELYRRFDAMSWDAASPTQALRPGTSSTGDYPPEDHPIWGKEGIMHGVVLKRGQGGRLTYHLDDRFTPRDAAAYGHNDILPGTWFARQECLRLHGGHAQRQRGIFGDPDRGAYSIVVSGEYDDTDKDDGDIIHYSAEGAHDKEPSRKAGVKGNRALDASLSTHNPVRVFRNAKGGGRFAPPCGIRYDGLYGVVGKVYKRNSKGGIFQLYKLRRSEDVDQPDLESLVRASPTPQQRADFARITAGY